MRCTQCMIPHAFITAVGCDSNGSKLTGSLNKTPQKKKVVFRIFKFQLVFEQIDTICMKP